MDVRYNNNALAELNDCIGGLLHLRLNVTTFRTLLHLGPNVITLRTNLTSDQYQYLGNCPPTPSLTQQQSINNKLRLMLG